MLRVRFEVNADDYRPVNWPLKHPYWCTGYTEDSAIIVSYADDEEYIFANWPEAKNLDYTIENGYTFTTRFRRPDWFKEKLAKTEASDE